MRLKTSAEIDVVALGEPMVLLLADPGMPLRQSASFRRSVAGSESNVAIGLARLGRQVQFQSRLSSDAFGDVIRSTLLAEGIDVVCATDGHRPTGVLIRDAHHRRAVEVLYHRAGSASEALTVEDLDLGGIASAKILHISGITPVLSDAAAHAVRSAALAAKEAGTLVSFDPNLRRRLCEPDRAAEILAPLLELADVILTGDDEAEALTGLPVAEAVEKLVVNAKIVVVKQGAKGAWATDGVQTWRQPVVAVDQVDPVGAGDAFAVGFIDAVLQGEKVDDALRRGATVAAMVVEVATDIDGLPTRSELENLEGVNR